MGVFSESKMIDGQTWQDIDRLKRALVNLHDAEAQRDAGSRKPDEKYCPYRNSWPSHA
jgi:hypothetical protein